MRLLFCLSFRHQMTSLILMCQSLKERNRDDRKHRLQQVGLVSCPSTQPPCSNLPQASVEASDLSQPQGSDERFELQPQVPDSPEDPLPTSPVEVVLEEVPKKTRKKWKPRKRLSFSTTPGKVTSALERLMVASGLENPWISLTELDSFDGFTLEDLTKTNLVVVVWNDYFHLQLSWNLIFVLFECKFNNVCFVLQKSSFCWFSCDFHQAGAFLISKFWLFLPKAFLKFDICMYFSNVYLIFIKCYLIINWYNQIARRFKKNVSVPFHPTWVGWNAIPRGF